MNKNLNIYSVSKYYKKSKKFANEDINLTFFPGEIVAITGHNGAGKTTLLNQIIGSTKPTQGSITYNGLSFSKDSKAARESSSMMPQLHAPLKGVTVTQSIEAILRIKGLTKNASQETSSKIIKALKMEEWKDTSGQNLSGGLRRLTSFAMTVSSPSPILLLDEPTNDVDPIRRVLIWKYLKKLSKEGHIVLVVTHNLLEVEKYADRYILMNKGKVLEEKDLRENPLETSQVNHLVVNFGNQIDAENIEIPDTLTSKYVSEELTYEFKMNNEQVINGVMWVMKLIQDKKIISYRLSPNSLNENYGEMLDGND